MMPRFVAISGLAVSIVVLVGMTDAPAEVFDGDPQDPITLEPYPILPGFPLILDGDDEKWNTDDDTVDAGFTGDTDLVVRVGNISSNAIPAPAGAASGPPLSIVVVGGGSTGSGLELPFTVMVSDGSGSPPYGNVITTNSLDNRGVTIFAFGDLDGDGVIGPTDSDGSADDALEAQEATAYLGRQVNALVAGRVQGTLGLQIAAPASIGGLTVSLSAGGYTGIDPDVLYTDGVPIFTRWPFFPPLDPSRILGNAGAPPPSPDEPSELEFEPERNLLPGPDDPDLGGLFAVPTDSSEPTTDQIVAISGTVVAAGLFTEVDPASFRSSARIGLRPAPTADGLTRTLVLPVRRLVIPDDGILSERQLRLMPKDVLGNIADPDVGGTTYELRAQGAVRIISPDVDADTSRENILVEEAAGADVIIDDVLLSGDGRIDVLAAGRVVSQTLVMVGTAVDGDGDGVADDGSGSGTMGDFLCQEDDLGLACDDNCPWMINPSQSDDDANGVGNCCDGTCIDDPSADGCAECALPDIGIGPVQGFEKLSVTARDGGLTKPDRLSVRAKFTLPASIVIRPDQDTVVLELIEQGSDRYLGTLAAAMPNLSNGTLAKYLYKDKDGLVDGITRARIKERKGSSYRAVWKVKGADLVDVEAGTLDLVLDVGNQRMETVLPCLDKGKSIKCRHP